MNNQVEFIQDQIQISSSKYSFLSKLVLDLKNKHVSLDKVCNMPLNETGMNKLIDEIDSFKKLLNQSKN